MATAPEAPSEVIRICAECGTKARGKETACEVCFQTKFIKECSKCGKQITWFFCPNCWSSSPTASQLGKICEGLFNYFRVVYKDTFEHFSRVSRLVIALITAFMMAQENAKARGKLADSMTKTREGDAAFRAEIEELRKKLPRLPRSGGGGPFLFPAMASEHQDPLLQLAAWTIASQPDVPPQLKKDYINASMCEKALEHERNAIRQGTREIYNKLDRGRIFLGYTLLVLFIILLIWLIRR